MNTNTNYLKLINDIITVLAQHGEEANDGECLDEVWGLLESAGYAKALRDAQAVAELAYEASK